MRRLRRLLPVFIFIFYVGTVNAQEDGNEQQTEESDTLKYPFSNQTGGLFLDNQIEYDVQYDAVNNRYVIWPKIGDIIVGEPIYMSADDYLDLILNRSIDEYYRDKSRAFDQMYRAGRFGDEEEDDGNILPSLKIKSKTFEDIFGGNEIQLIPQGQAQLDLGVFLQKIDNPQLLPQNRNTMTVDLRQRIQMSVLGKVGENLQLQANYDTQAGFGFENEMKLQWKNRKEGGEDDILQNIEVGNISMPLNTSLITGAQSLFGVRTDLKFGRTDFSLVFSEQRSESRNITVQGGGVMTDFKVHAEDYDYNQHFFLGQFFRNSYDDALANYPQISSDINITRMEVYRIDRGNSNQENRRAVLALRDIGENGQAPTNGALYNQVSGMGGIRDASNARSIMNGFNFGGDSYQEGEHYLVNENVKKLNESEYTFYPSLGYISLNSPLNDGEDLLAVSFQYTRNSTPGVIYKVGEMSDEQNSLLITKLIKPNTTVNTGSPMWDLMMKNIYSIDAMSISPEDFIMDIKFKDNSENSSGKVNYLPNTPVEDQTLLQVMHMDRLDLNGNLQMSGNGHYGDGIFDFVEGVTVDSRRGTIIFTTVEPFGNHLAEVLGDPDSKYIFKELYRQLPNTLMAEKLSQRYSLSGRYKGEMGGGIPLGAFNVPEGSVKVTANGMELIEGVDYTVDYQSGQVTILNEQLKNSGVPINISMENQSTFNMQKKRFMGFNVEHRFSDNFLLGGTFVNYQERPVTHKTQFGEEAVSNSIVGLHTEYTGESEFLTRLTNKIPGIKTDQISQIDFSAEGAYLMPGQNKASQGNSYIDDFEDSQSKISLKDYGSWKLASVPGKPAGYQGDTHPFFPNGNLNDDLEYGNGRRLMSWYSIDPRFYSIGGNAPAGITNSQLSQHRARRIELKELFDQRDVMAGTAAYISTFDMTFFPELTGPYNVNPNNTETVGWGGAMRAISVSNFVDSNIEYLEFWMMDPYADGTGGNGDLLIQLGSVSEDILKDGKMMYENGMPHSGNGAQTTETSWGKQPDNFPVLYAYETEGAARKEQDLGYNGLTDAEEAALYGINNVNPITGENDPASDNYVYPLDERWGQSPDAGSIPGRYKYYQNPQGNNSTDNMLESYSMQPDAEDINLDYNLDQTEFYNQYTIKLSPADLDNNTSDYIVATKEVDVDLPNGQKGSTKWYQFRVPVDGFDRDIDGDGVDDLVTEEQLTAAKSVLSSVRFMRVLMRGFQQETTLRFASMDFVRSDWRRYPKNLFPTGGNIEEGSIIDEHPENLEIGQVNIEQNGSNVPPYVLPPGIEREQLQGTTGYQAQNEASMSLKAKLGPSDQVKGVYKNVNLDLRRYKKLKMFVHAEDLLDATNQSIDEGTRVFIRMGSDYSDNYYEYEIPIKYTARTPDTNPDRIWPVENRFDLNTDLLVEAKKMRDMDELVTPLTRYALVPDEEEPTKVIYVKGRPSLGEVTSIMIGIRSYDHADKEVLIWVNELRLSDIDNESGYAARASLGFTLGDFAQVQLSGSVTSAGFGPIDLGPSQRSQEDYKDYALNAQIKLDKFLPEEWGMEIPFNVTMSEQFSDPKFNPLDDDVELKDDPRKDELKDVVRSYGRQKSFAFSNIRKTNTSGKDPKFYDPSNFTLSFMYADTYERDVFTKFNLTKNIKASLNYNYNFKPWNYEPMKDWRAVQNDAESAKYLKFLKEVNFNPVPTRFSFRTDIDRLYSQRQYRDIEEFFGGGTANLFPIAFSNNFLFSWQYNLGWDLTRSLRIDYTSSTRTLNDGNRFQRADKGMVWKDFFSIGRPVNYDQQVQLNWKTPIRYLPYLDWIDLELGFTSNYNWQARSTVFLNADTGDGKGLGNIAQNTNGINTIGTFDLKKLYKYFDGHEKMDSVRKARKREIDSLSQAYDDMSLRALRRIKKGYKFKHKFKAKDYVWMVVSSVKNFKFNYNQTNGAVVPGILAEPNFFGFGKNGGGPGAGFMFGTEFDIKRKLIESGNDWVTRSEQLLEPYIIDKSTSFNATSMVEPIPNLRIDLSAKRMSTYRSTEYGFNLRTRDKPDLITFDDKMRTLNSSNIALATSFMDADALFEKFMDNSRIISERLGMANGMTPGTDGFYDGYGLANYDVLIPAFRAAIEGRSASGISLGYNRRVPLPNWTITYDGLINIPLFNRWFDSFEVSHAYLSSYTVNGIQTNPNHFMDPNGRDLNNNFYSDNVYGSVSMVESFSPLIGIDLTLRNDIQIRAEYNRDRTMMMSLSNYSLTEDRGAEYVIGMGYIIRDLKFRLRYQGKNKTFTGDMNFRADLRLRDSETRIRRILDGDSQVTGGQKQLSFQFTTDYSFTKNFKLQLFWDQMISKYKISTAFPISTIRAGISLILSFGN